MYTITPVPDKVKHTGAHILAAALTRLKPSVKLGIGPVTKDGFYYDVDLTKPLTEKDFPRIEKEADKIIKENLPMQQIILNREEAMNLLLQRGQTYKAELIKSIPDQEISFYKTGDGFIDLCRGPHAYSTGEVGAIKITRIEDIHWNEDPSRPKMQRIYGIVFNNKNELSDYFKIKEEEGERNYKKILKTQGLGLALEEDKVVLNTNGTVILNSINKIIFKYLLPFNSKEIYINSSESSKDLSEFINQIFASKLRSPKEFPITYKTEVSLPVNLYKNEKETHRVVFIKKYFIEGDELSHTSEIENITDIIKELKIDVKANIYNVDPEASLVSVISNLLQKEGISHSKVLTKNPNDTIISFKAIDIFNREWNIAEVKFEKDIQTSDKKIAVSIEYLLNSFAIFAYILEHNKGEIPQSISPKQVVIIPINKNYMEYAYKVQETLKENGIISDVDFRSISLKRKIYLAEQNKSSIQIIVGEKEQANNSVSVRHKNIDQGLISMNELIKSIESLMKI